MVRSLEGLGFWPRTKLSKACGARHDFPLIQKLHCKQFGWFRVTGQLNIPVCQKLLMVRESSCQHIISEKLKLSSLHWHPSGRLGPLLSVASMTSHKSYHVEIANENAESWRMQDLEMLSSGLQASAFADTDLGHT